MYMCHSVLYTNLAREVLTTQKVCLALKPRVQEQITNFKMIYIDYKYHGFMQPVNNSFHAWDKQNFYEDYYDKGKLCDFSILEVIY